jgi:hypothetical protein
MRDLAAPPTHLATSFYTCWGCVFTLPYRTPVPNTAVFESDWTRTRHCRDYQQLDDRRLIPVQRQGFLFSLPRLGLTQLPIQLISQGIFYALLISPMRAICPAHLILLHFSHPNNIWWSGQVTRLLITQSAPASSHFLPLTDSFNTSKSLTDSFQYSDLLISQRAIFIHPAYVKFPFAFHFTLCLETYYLCCDCQWQVTPVSLVPQLILTSPFKNSEMKMSFCEMRCFSTCHLKRSRKMYSNFVYTAFRTEFSQFFTHLLLLFFSPWLHSPA